MILAEAEIEHLVGLVEHHGLQAGDIEPMPLDMVAQAAGRADDDMRALVEQRGFATRIHAADAGDDLGVGVFVQPRQFALHLQRQFARRRDDQRQGLAGAGEGFVGSQQRRGDGEPIGYRLARAGLGGDQQVAPCGGLFEHRVLDGCRIGVIAFVERTRKRRARGKEGHRFRA